MIYYADCLLCGEDKYELRSLINRAHKQRETDKTVIAQLNDKNVCLIDTVECLRKEILLLKKSLHEQEKTESELVKYTKALEELNSTFIAYTEALNDFKLSRIDI